MLAYNTLIEAYDLNPKRNHKDLKDWIVSNEPEYKAYFDEAFEWLQEHRRESSSLAISIFHGSIWQ